MSAPSTPTESGVWQADGFSTTVEYSLAVMEEIRRRAVDELNALGHGGLEIGGVLYGVRHGDILRVLASAEGPCEHALGPGFVLSEKDRLGLAKLVGAPPAGMETIGWYCSHTRSRVVLTPNDCAIFERFFPRPRQVALVVKPTLLGPAQAAFLFLEPFAPHREFSLQPRPIPPISPVADSRPAAPARPPQPRRAKARAATPVKRAWLWVAPALAAAGLLIASQLISPRLGLEARAVAPGQVRIAWNRHAGPVLEASSGLLEIKDGATRVVLPLSADQLRAGTVTYARRSTSVALRLHIERRKRGAPAFEESIRFVPPPAPQDAPQRPAPAAAVIAAVAAPAPEAKQAPAEPGPAGNTEADRQALEPPLAPAPERTAVAMRERPAVGTMERMAVAVPAPIPARRRVQLAMPAPSAAPAPVLPAAPALPLSAHAAEAMPLPLSVSGSAPRSGRIFWTGKLVRRGVVEIDGAHATIGSLTGALPGVPLTLRVSPVEFAAGGLVVFTSDAARNGRSEPASQANGWNTTRFAWDPERGRQIDILEAPNPRNGFTRLVLRNNARGCAMILIEWRVP